MLCSKEGLKYTGCYFVLGQKFWIFLKWKKWPIDLNTTPNCSLGLAIFSYFIVFSWLLKNFVQKIAQFWTWGPQKTLIQEKFINLNTFGSELFYRFGVSWPSKICRRCVKLCENTPWTSGSISTKFYTFTTNFSRSTNPKYTKNLKTKSVQIGEFLVYYGLLGIPGPKLGNFFRKIFKEPGKYNEVAKNGQAQ